MTGYRTNIVDLAKREGWSRIALVGLGNVALFELLLTAAPGAHVTAVDHFVYEDRKHRALAAASRHPGRATVLIMTTGQAAPLVPDASLDFVYLAAGHKYGCVRADLRAWWPKVRIGGQLGGHGYGDGYPGVVRAVDERFNGTVCVGDGPVWLVKRT